MTHSKKRIMIVDDEPLIGSSLEEALQKWDFEATLLSEGQSALKLLKEQAFDMVLTDIRMPQLSGMQVLKQVKKASPQTGVVMITAFGTIDQAVKAMKMGAYDYITKPFSLDEIKFCLEKYFKTKELEEENFHLKRALEEKYSLNNFVGQNREIRDMLGSLEIAFESDATVFIQSENGTGKELVASAIHYNSPRKTRPFVKINCASIPENLIESQLFGHEKGAFTGAIRTVKGVFEEAHEGTLLLDEVTEMPTHLQAKLLRVLQEGEFRRVGNSKTIKTDVRIIATSNCDVQRAIEEGSFRQDLFFRLDVVSVRIPPLRERKDDIPLLSEHFVRKYATKYSQNVTGVDDGVLAMFCNYHWPGNVRELENVIQRGVLSCKEGGQISTSHLKNYWPFVKQEQNLASILNEDLSIAEMEKHLIGSTLKRYDYHKTKTAEILGITLKTLRSKILQYGIDKSGHPTGN